MLWHIALTKQNALLGIETAGEEVDGEIPHMITQQRAIVDGGQRVVIRDEIIGIAFMLQLQSRLHHAKVIADVETSAGLETGKNAHRPLDMAEPERGSSTKLCSLSPSYWSDFSQTSLRISLRL